MLVGERLCINSDQHVDVEERARDSGMRDAEPAGEARRRKPTKKASSSAPDRAIYGSRCRDPIGHPECGLEVLIDWEPRTRSLGFFQNVLRLLTHVCSN